VQIVTLPIPSTVFVDGQLVDEAGLYANVFTPINVLYAQLQTLTQANGHPERHAGPHGWHWPADRENDHPVIDRIQLEHLLHE
jgi:hypothetical protein